MGHRLSLVVLAVAYALLTAALTWLFGPYGLLGCSVVLGAVALVWPDRTEPTPEQIAEAVRKALEGQ